jgi:hypothetical protein
VFHLHIPIPLFDDIDINYKLVDTSVPIASFEKPWDESHRLRIGTESTLGDPTQGPTVSSHIGADPAFLSFPATVPTVAACLADPTAVPDPPQACGSTPATGAPAQIPSCISMPISIQIDPCLNIPTADADPCLNAQLTYMCSSVAKEQWFESRYMLAHKLTLDPGVLVDPYDLVQMTKIATTCAASLGLPPPSGAKDWFAATFTVGPCDDTATLKDPKDVISTPGPSAVTPGTCH